MAHLAERSAASGRNRCAYWNQVASGSAAGNNGRVIDSAAARRSTALDPQIAAMLKRDPAGLVPAVIQEQDSGEV